MIPAIVHISETHNSKVALVQMKETDFMDDTRYNSRLRMKNDKGCNGCNFLHLLMYCHNSNVQLLQVTLKDISVIEKKSLFFGKI